MHEDLFEPLPATPHPFHPLDMMTCYSILDSMTVDELLEFGNDPVDAYKIINQAFTITG